MDKKNIGLISSEPGAKFHDPVQMYDAMYGKYVGNVSQGSVESRLPTVQMPMAPEPKPFVMKGGK